MSVAISIRRATIDDAEMFTALLREEDRRELEASGKPIDQVKFSIEMSQGHSWLVSFNGEPALIIGYVDVSLLTGAIMPWFMSTDQVKKYPKTFYRFSKQVVDLFRYNRVIIGNLVDSRYEETIRWARHVGFSIGETVLVGPNRVPFYRLMMGG